MSPRFYLGWLSLFLALSASPALAAADGTFTLYRWNQGFKAESEPVRQEKIARTNFQDWLSKREYARDPGLYTGCYLAKFEPAMDSRSPASTVAAPVSYRVCVPAKSR